MVPGPSEPAIPRPATCSADAGAAQNTIQKEADAGVMVGACTDAAPLPSSQPTCLSSVASSPPVLTHAVCGRKHAGCGPLPEPTSTQPSLLAGSASRGHSPTCPAAGSDIPPTSSSSSSAPSRQLRLAGQGREVRMKPLDAQACEDPPKTSEAPSRHVFFKNKVWVPKPEASDSEAPLIETVIKSKRRRRSGSIPEDPDAKIDNADPDLTPLLGDLMACAALPLDLPLPGAHPDDFDDHGREPAGDAESDHATPGLRKTTWELKREGFHLTVNDRPFVIEIFAGSARLTRAFRSKGADAWAVDWRGGRLARECPAFLTLDLTLERDQQVLLRMLAHPNLVYVH